VIVDSMDVWGALGWVLWGVTAFTTLVWSFIAAFMRTPERWLNQQRCFEAILLAVATVATFSAIPKWHIVWCLPLILVILGPVVLRIRMSSASKRLSRTFARLQQESEETGVPLPELLKRENERRGWGS